MRQKRLGGLFAAAVFLLCAVMTGTYLIAGYGAYLDSDMASELALASHLAEEGKLISGTWVYSTEVRVLSTQLIFTPLMALFPHDWRLVRTLGCLILQGILAASAYFCGRALGADKKFSLLFAGLSISVCSVVYAQMVTIGAYYVPHAVLTNLCVGMTADAHGEGQKAGSARRAAAGDVRADGRVFHPIPVLRDDSRRGGRAVGVYLPERSRKRAADEGAGRADDADAGGLRGQRRGVCRRTTHIGSGLPV